jgi:hypothetical protein
VEKAFDLLGAEVEAGPSLQEFIGLGKGAAARGYGDDLAEQARGKFGRVDTEAARVGKKSRRQWSQWAAGSAPWARPARVLGERARVAAPVRGWPQEGQRRQASGALARCCAC